MRIAARVAVFALIGAAATVLVAWGCVVAERKSGSLYRLALVGGWRDPIVFYERRARGSNAQWMADLTRARYDRMEREGRAFTAFREFVDGGKAPPWVSRQWPEEGGELPVVPRVAHLEAGWPRRALQCQWRYVDSPGATAIAEAEYGIDLDATADRLQTAASALPLKPLWPGFLVDTAFWGGAAFAIRNVPGFVRRRARLRRGRCVRCGYELKELTACPECGGGA